MAVDPPFRMKNMMPGMIMLWYGAVADIPSGWHLCDGDAGTPDLRNKFVICAHHDVFVIPVAEIDGFYQSTGGSGQHNHDFTGDGHAHDLGTGNEVVEDSPDGHHSHVTTVSPASGTTDQEFLFPPCFALAYIMKLPIP